MNWIRGDDFIRPGKNDNFNVSFAGCSDDTSHVHYIGPLIIWQDVTVKGNTDLKGGVLASDAEASKNRFVTGTLTTSDIENKAEYKSDSSNVSLSYSGGSSNPNGTITAPGDIKPDGASAPGTALQTAGSNLASNAAGNAIGAKEGTASGTTKSAISAGAIVITDEAGQVAKTGKTADETKPPFPA